MKKMSTLIASLGILLTGSVFCLADEPVSFKLVVHVSNPVSELTKIEILNLFLKKSTNGKKAEKACFPLIWLKIRRFASNFRRVFTVEKSLRLKPIGKSKFFPDAGRRKKKVGR